MGTNRSAIGGASSEVEPSTNKDHLATGDPIAVELEFLSSELRADLLERWNEPARVYHNETHLRSVLRAIDFLAAEGEAFDGLAVRLAAWLHCAVYDPAASENSEKSARLAERVLPEGAPVDEVVRLIRMTAGHAVTDGDLDAAALSDADLAVLGSDPDTYAVYTADVRQEFAHVPEDRYVAGRRVAVEALLARKSIFRTAAARDAWEKQAHANLNRELGTLGV